MGLNTPLGPVLVSHGIQNAKYKMQNTNYFRMMKYKISKFSGLVPSKMSKFPGLGGGSEGSFVFFWPFEAKIKNTK
jgi:hypothetical protein